jgi:predicted permease
VSASFARIHSWLRSVMRRQRLEGEMEEEIRFHLEARAEDLMHQGLTPSQATRQARVEFGGVATHKDEIRHSLGLRWWDELWSDLGYGLRILKKSPGFTAIAVGSLALAIGANTTIFSVANELLFERLAVPHPEQLRLLTVTGDQKVVINLFWGNDGGVSNGRTRFDTFTYPVYQQLRARNHVLEQIFAFKDFGRANITVDGNARSVSAELVSGNFYQQLQVQPQLGRVILPSDDQAPGTGAVVVISDSFWNRAFNRSPGVIGKMMTVNMIPMTVVGVNPPGFTGAESVQVSPDLFMPLSMAPSMRGSIGDSGSVLSSSNLWWIQLMARAKPGISNEQARAALDVVLRAAVRSTMTIEEGSTLPRIEVEDGSRGLNYAARDYSAPLYVLLAMVSSVLLLACANMANLMLARAAVRQREMSVRLALGAGRWRILRQVLTESLLLSCAGGALGLLLGYSGRTLLPNLVASSWEDVEMNIPFHWKVFAFTAGITIGTGILFGIFPAWAATRAEIGAALKQGSQTASRRRKAWTGKSIVAFQVALSTLLVVAAVLFLRTLTKLIAIDPGFRTDHLLLFEISLPENRYQPPKDVALQSSLEDELRTVPGVEGVTASDVPLLSGEMMNGPFFPEGAPHTDFSRATEADRHDMRRFPAAAHVGNDFISVMKIPMIAGRAFTRQDTEGSPKVAIINQALARKFFPNQNPIGKRFTQGPSTSKSTWVQIVGVCADTRYNNLRDNPPPLHLGLYRQEPAVDDLTFMIRTPLQPE